MHERIFMSVYDKLREPEWSLNASMPSCLFSSAVVGVELDTEWFQLTNPKPYTYTPIHALPPRPSPGTRTSSRACP